MSSSEDKCLIVRLSDYFYFVHGMYGIKIILQAWHSMACPQPIEIVFKQPQCKGLVKVVFYGFMKIFIITLQSKS